MRAKLIAALFGIVVVLLAAAAFLVRFEYAPVPHASDLINPARLDTDVAYDLFGERISRSEAERLSATDAGRKRLSLASGAVRVDADLRRIGREAFYAETFGNEWFMTDVMGLTHGALTPFQVAKAVLSLRGRGTSNLRVELAETVSIDGRTYRKGTPIATGIDVPRGSYAPLGMKVVYDRGRIRVGATCALCHSTVDAGTGRVVEGAPNADLAVGLLLALATNSASYLGHVTVQNIEEFAGDAARTVTGRNGGQLPLPDPVLFERAVDDMLAAWAPGSFDSTPDVVNNPTQIPDSFTFNDHPYGWSGFAAVGPFRGLNVLNNNVHGLNADMTTLAQAAPALFGMDSEVYLGAILQNAANARFRFDPTGGRTPSTLLAEATPAPEGPGLIQSVRLPTFPQAAHIATHSLLASVPGYPVWHHVTAMSAFQNSLLPPQSSRLSETMAASGRAVFERAGCVQCHSGPAYTNNRILPVDEVGAQPSRARALMKQGAILAPSVLYPLDSPVPVPPGTPAVPVPVAAEQQDMLRLAFALDGKGGYKVKGLVGLAWTAPYLHDGGVAVGANADREIGLPGTLYAGIAPHPANSLRALLDRDLRRRVVEANSNSPRARATNVSGQGHEHYVDAVAGFSPEDQSALIAFLLAITGPDRQASR